MHDYRVTLKLARVGPDGVQRVLTECPVSSREIVPLCSSDAAFTPVHGAGAGCYGDGLLASARWPGYTGFSGLNIPSPFKGLRSCVGCHFVSWFTCCMFISLVLTVPNTELMKVPYNSSLLHNWHQSANLLSNITCALLPSREPVFLREYTLITDDQDDASVNTQAVSSLN